MASSQNINPEDLNGTLLLHGTGVNWGSCTSPNSHLCTLLLGATRSSDPYSSPAATREARIIPCNRVLSRQLLQALIAGPGIAHARGNRDQRMARVFQGTG
jgi:hypothetical protein